MSDDQNMLMCLAEYLRSVDKDAAKAFDYASKVDELRRRIAAPREIVMDDIKSLLQMLRYWETEPCLPGPAKTCKEARELIEQQAARIAELEARLAANGAEPYAYELHLPNDEYSLVYAAYLAKYATEEERECDRLALYTAPVAIGPRYDWTVSGMKQSETGNWVLASNGDAK